MKTTNYILFAALAALSLSVACSKEQNIGSPEKVQTAASESGKVITINATLPDATKVNFEAKTDEAGKAKLILTWNQNDKLRVYDASKPDSYADFDLTSGAGTKVATFSGTAPEATSYDVAVINNATATQEQASDGDTGHLVYGASASGLSLDELKTIQFTSISSVLGLTAKLPAGATKTITSVNITASNDIFYGGKELEISINTQADTDDDDFLKVFATMPMGDQTIPAGTELFIKFNSNNDKHKVYTRYYKFEADKTLIGGKLNELRMDCSKTDQHAGLASCDGTTEAKAYLIADPYQVAAINGLASEDYPTFFKMIDDVNMNGVSHNPINTNKNTGYPQVVNFDGNGKKISNLGKHFFYVFKGSIKDLTLDHSTVSSRGIFAEYCQGTGHTITNVDIVDSSINNESDPNVGALIGNIDSGTDGSTTVTISNCNVSGTNVTAPGPVGGLIGYATAKSVIYGCTYTGGTVRSKSKFAGGLIGSTGGNDAVAETIVSDCYVENTTVDASGAGDDARAGGFIGQLGKRTYIKGCTVGSSDTKVKVNVGVPTASGKVMNSGGFVGVCYGTITQNESTRNKAYTVVSSSCTEDWQLNLGGFVGYAAGTIEFCDADVEIKVKGRYIGGFAGYATSATTAIKNCSVTADVQGGTYTGGFVGYSNGITLSGNSASGTVKTSNNSTGGFIGACKGGTIENNTTSMTVSGNTYVGGFVGYVLGGTFSGTRTNTNSRSTNIASGNVSGEGNGVGGFVGTVYGNEVSFDGCDAAGSVEAKGNCVGGFVGRAFEDTSFSHCRYWGTSVKSTEKNGYVGGFCGATYNSDNTSNKICAFKGTFSKCWVSPGSPSGLEVSASGGSAGENQRVGGFIGNLGTNSALAENTGKIEKCRVDNATISGGQYTGGFAGVSYGDISQCCVIGGSVSARGASVGGFAGYQQSHTISNCYTTVNNVSSSGSNIGGMVGNIKDGTTVEYSYVGGITIGGTGSYKGSFIGIGVSGATQKKCISWVNLDWQGSGNTGYIDCHWKSDDDTYISTWATTYGWNNEIWNIPSNSDNLSLKETETIMDI